MNNNTAKAYQCSRCKRLFDQMQRPHDYLEYAEINKVYGQGSMYEGKCLNMKICDLCLAELTEVWSVSLKA